MKKTVFLVCAVMILALVPGCKWPFGKKEVVHTAEVAHVEAAHHDAAVMHEEAHHDAAHQDAAHAVETPHKI